MTWAEALMIILLVFMFMFASPMAVVMLAFADYLKSKAKK